MQRVAPSDQKKPASKVLKPHAQTQSDAKSEKLNFEVYTKMRKKEVLTDIQYSAIIKETAKTRHLPLAWQVFQDAVDSGWDDVTCYTNMIQTLCILGQKKRAWDIFQQAIMRRKTNDKTINVFINECQKKEWTDILQKIEEANWDMSTNAGAEPYNGKKPDPIYSVSTDILFKIEKKLQCPSVRLQGYIDSILPTKVYAFSK